MSSEPFATASNWRENAFHRITSYNVCYTKLLRSRYCSVCGQPLNETDIKNADALKKWLMENRDLLTEFLNNTTAQQNRVFSNQNLLLSRFQNLYHGMNIMRFNRLVLLYNNLVVTTCREFFLFTRVVSTIVITSYSIHYTKLYESEIPPLSLQ